MCCCDHELTRDAAALANSLGSSGSSVFSSRRAGRAGSAPNREGTFLTECSFGVAYDDLLRAVTDMHAYEPDWQHLAFVDLSGRGLESLARLKEFLPSLQEANLCVGIGQSRCPADGAQSSQFNRLSHRCSALHQDVVAGRQPTDQSDRLSRLPRPGEARHLRQPGRLAATCVRLSGSAGTDDWQNCATWFICASSRPIAT